MSALATLIKRSAPFAGYKTHTYNTNPMVPSAQGTMTQAEATERVLDHLAAHRARSVTADQRGDITLSAGDRRTRLTPGVDAHPSKLTTRQTDDILLIASDHHARLVDEDARGIVIQGLVWRIPATATETLTRHGWIVTTGLPGDPVTMSLAAHVALTWRHLKTTRVPVDEWGAVIAEAITDGLGTAHPASA